MVVKSGETVVMGGVLERERSTFVEAVPVLGDLPSLGTFFRRRTEVDTPRYLLIFVTATIVKDTGEFLVYDEPGSASLTNSRPALQMPPARLPAAAAPITFTLSNPPPATAASTNLAPAIPASTNAAAQPK